MATLDSGVIRYIKAEATVRVGFPVDHKGTAHICCFQCGFYRRNYRKCGLNHEIVEFPEYYVGGNCPLKIIEEESNLCER